MTAVAITLAVTAWGLYLYRTLVRLEYIAYPIDSYGLAALAVAVGFFAGGLAFSVTLFLGVLFAFWTAYFSRMPEKPLGVRVGNPAPDFTLPDARGDPFRLSSLRGQKNALLIFYRGHW